MAEKSLGLASVNQADVRGGEVFYFIGLLNCVLLCGLQSALPERCTVLQTKSQNVRVRGVREFPECHNRK